MVKKQSTDNSQICAILSYLLIGIIWFFVDEKLKKDAFAKFHVKQAIVLMIFSIGISIILSILSAILFFMSWLFLIILIPLVSLGTLILWIIGLIYAATNKKKELPIIGGFAKHLTF